MNEKSSCKLGSSVHICVQEANFLKRSLIKHYAQVNLLTDNLEQSFNDFKKCVTLDPDFALGVVQGHYAEYRKAVQGGSMTGIAKVIEKFKRDIRKFPKCSESYVLLAQVRLSDNDLINCNLLCFVVS